jgi:hypothetical protein
MSQGEDFGAAVGFRTMRGRDYPTIRQFTIFLENRVGALQGLLRKFSNTRIRIIAINIIESTECCIVRFVLSHPEQGREILERAGLAMIESDLIALELSDTRQPLLEICNALLRAEINLIQSYPLMLFNNDSPAVAIMVDNVDQAQMTLSDQGFTMLSERDLQDTDE